MYLARSKEALKKVLNNDHSIESRLDNLELLQHLPFESKNVTLYSLCDNSQPVQLQTAALKQIWDADDSKIGYELVKRWRTMGPQARRSASDILLYKESHHDALLTGLEDSVINIGEMNFDLERRRTLLWWTDNEETKRRAELLFSDSGVMNRKEAMEEMSVAISQEGQVENGQLVFEQLCAQCHIYDGEGSDVGPVLTEINRKSKESLLHDIIDPNAAVDTKYINHKIETKDGRIIFGMVDLETDNSITLKNIGGQVNTIEKSEIENFQSLGTSLMMEGLEANMSHSDMADLLAFLQQPINL